MKHGFTITELMVTIGIVVALAGIGFPLFKGMKESANEAACVSRLRGLGMSMESYLLDHGNFFPNLQMGRKSGSSMNSVLEVVLLPYVEGPEAFRCPSDHEDYAATGSSYFWNHHASGLKKSRVVMMGMAAGSSKIPLIHDKEAYHGDEDGTNFLFLDMSAGKDLEFEVESE